MKRAMNPSVWRGLALALISLWLGTGCSSTPKDVGVAVVGVNYTDFEYSMQVLDPLDAKNRGSTGELMPYAAGGQMCCFSLPAQWRPGIQVQLISLKAIVENGRWVRDDKTAQTVTLPPYTAGEPGTLWLMQYPEGKVEAVSSTLSPAHPQWPGSVKGGPVPSLAHRTKMWKVYYDQAVGYVRLYEGLLADLKATPDKEAREAWAYAAQRKPDEIKGFSGPDDLRYRSHLRAHYESSLLDSKAQERKLLEEKPR